MAGIKKTGSFREVQNNIGHSGSTINDAVFITPPPSMIPQLLTSLLNFYISEDYDIPHLLKAALIHVQFETIHSFRTETEGLAGF